MIGLFLGSWILAVSLQAAEVTELAPIVHEVGYSPADLLMEDSIVPKQVGPVSSVSSSGGVESTLSREVPLPLTESHVPGAIAQVRGVGRASSDTQVQSLGVPLTPPQGGGFDFTIFPAYLWSEYRLVLGAVAGGPDPRGVSGALTLVPWTADAILSGWKGVQAQAMHSTARLSQIGVRGAGEGFAIVQGFEAGAAKGPSTSASVAKKIGDTRVSAHLLFSQIDAESLGSHTYPTPSARQKTTRVIPIAQAELGEGRPIFSAFYDHNEIEYTEPGSNYRTLDKIAQGGMQAAWKPNADWRFGILARQTSYQKIDFDAPSESTAQFQISRTHHWDEGQWTLEPTFQAVLITRYGFSPSESIGVRRQIGSDGGVFARASYAQKIPTLTDRYYAVPSFFTGNPDLKPEKVTSLSAGWDGAHEKLTATLQYRGDAQVNSTLNGGELFPVNVGSAWVVSLLYQLSYSVGRLELSNGLTWNHSELTSTGLDFPYMPALIDVIRARFQAAPHWSLGWDARFASSSLANSSTGMRVGGYGLHNLSLNYGPLETATFLVQLRVENLFDRAAEPISDYPVQGRSWVLNLSLALN